MREALGPAQAQQVDAMQKLLDQVGQAFNLFWWLSPSLLGVPGLMVGAPVDKTPAGQPLVWPISSVLVYFGLFVVLNLLGLAAFGYLLERCSPAACAQRPRRAAHRRVVVGIVQDRRSLDRRRR